MPVAFDDLAASESNRLSALADLAILDTPAEAAYDDIVLLATQICDAPVALVSLVDRDRQWFKARIGFPDCQTSLDRSVCAHSLRQDEMLVIPDLTLDPRTADNPLVTGDPFVRFYAGAQLRTLDGVALGALCVLDTVARPDGLTPVQARGLRALANQVAANLELRKAIAQRDRVAADKARADAIAAAFAQQNEALLGVQALIAEAKGDLDTMLRAVVTGLLRAVATCDGAVVALCDGRDLVYRAASGSMGDFAGSRFPLSAHLGSGLAVLTGETQVTTDAAYDARVEPALAKRFKIASMIIVPLKRQGDAIGMLMLKSGETSAFTERDVSAARMLAVAVSGGLSDAAATLASKDEREAIAKLYASEARLQTIIDTVPVGIMFAEAPSGRIVGRNERMQEIVGAPSNDMKTIQDYGRWKSYHADGRQVEAHEYPLTRVIRDGVERAFLQVHYERRDGSLIWLDLAAAPVRDRHGTLSGAVVAVLDIDARKAAEAAQSLTNDELSHRMKNLMSIVLSIATSTLRNAVNVADARKVLTDRLTTLGKAHDVLLTGLMAPAPLADIVMSGIGVHADEVRRFQIGGPAVVIGEGVALALAMMVHELTTNAAKYGALSNADGRVAITWSLLERDEIGTGNDDGPDLRIVWRETGGPPVAAPSSKGFGSRLIERGLTGHVGGRISIDYDRAGLVCVAQAPLARFQRRIDRQAADGTSAC